ncbi:hypothetical protein CQ018_00430 [Arthrobacter sp. MYb227]|nr:hypothetical protein CQ018_00430 [Arthrobacter sp. MYb227]
MINGCHNVASPVNLARKVEPREELSALDPVSSRYVTNDHALRAIGKEKEPPHQGGHYKHASGKVLASDEGVKAD